MSDIKVDTINKNDTSTFWNNNNSANESGTKTNQLPKETTTGPSNVDHTTPHEEKVESTQQQNETVHHVETNPNNNTVENSVETKKENGAHIETVQNEKTDAENGVTPQKGKNGKNPKTVSTKKGTKKEVTPKEEAVKKPKSDTKKKKKKGEESENDDGSEEEEKVKSKPLARAKSEVITIQKKNRGVDKDEFEKYSNLLNQKTHRKKK